MDYRVEPGWHSHPKRRRLRRRLGGDAVLALMDLWEFCANEIHERTDGDLTGLSDEDIADAAGWEGDASVFVMALVDCRLLDGVEGHRAVHDWPLHQPFVAAFLKRSEQATHAAQKRWHAHRMPTACAPHAHRNADPENEQCPDRSDPIRSDPGLTDPIRPSGRTVRREPAAPSPPPDATPLVAFVMSTWPDVRTVPETAWRDACPALDLLAEARKAHAWELSQPASRRKRDHRRFLDGWLRRAQERAATARLDTRQPPPRATSPAATKEDFDGGPQTI